MSSSSSPAADVLVIQHTPVEGLGRLAPLLRDAGLRAQLVAADAPLPPFEPGRAAGVIVLGGPMGVYEADRHPRLRDEMRLIERALAVGTPLLGVCLGSQLLAAVLGAPVTPGPAKELGWLDVMLAPEAAGDPLFSRLPPVFPALHWHGDVFELPSGAVPLARSALTRRQAFAHGRAWGLLFHLEADVPQVRAMTEAFADEVREVGQTPERLVAASLEHDARAAQLAAAVFGPWVALARARVS